MDREKILKEYRRYLKLKKVKTHKDFIASIKEFFQFLGDDDFLKVRITDGEEYRKSLIEANKSHGTINNKLNRLRGFYQFLAKKNILQENPFKYWKV